MVLVHESARGGRGRGGGSSTRTARRISEIPTKLGRATLTIFGVAGISSRDCGRRRQFCPIVAFDPKGTFRPAYQVDVPVPQPKQGFIARFRSLFAAPRVRVIDGIVDPSPTRYMQRNQLELKHLRTFYHGNDADKVGDIGCTNYSCNQLRANPRYRAHR